ncbi:hypothetical protein N824_29630 [Pedobacter sp. V48]|nr:hypothetical protein N824_29630 [Pedobacter sp. V48]
MSSTCRTLPAAKTDQIKALTVGYYVFGALVTALIACAFKQE